MLLIVEPDQREVVGRSFDLGANDWLARPLNPGELRARARNQIRRKLYQDKLCSDVDTTLKLAAEALLEQRAGLDVHQASVVCCILIGAP